MADDRKAQAGPPQRPRSCPVHPEESFEDPRQGIGRNTGARICYGQDDLLAPFHDAYGDRSAVLGILYGVVDQVGQGPFHQRGVATRRFFCLEPEGKLQMLAGDLLRESLRDPFGYPVEVAGRDFDLILSGLDPGELEEVLDQRLQPVGMMQYGVDEAAQRGRIVHGAVQQGLDIALDGGQGGPELVGHVGHEVLPDLLEAPQFGRVVEHGDHAVQLRSDAYGRQVHLEDALAPLKRQVEYGVPVQRGRGVDRGVHRALQVMVAHHLDRPLVQTPGVHLHHALECRVDHQDPAGRGGDHDAFRHA